MSLKRKPLNTVRTLSRNDEERLLPLFQEYPYIAACWLFGSSLHPERLTPMSDIDLAFLLNEPHPSGRECVHEMDYLAYRAGKVLGVPAVDCIVLSERNLVFSSTVLRCGRLIYDGDPPCRVSFVARIISRYADFEPTLRFMEPYRLRGFQKRLAGTKSRIKHV